LILALLFHFFFPASVQSSFAEYLYSYFRIFQTMLSIQYPFSHYRKNGYGVSHGVVMPQNRKQKPSIFATTP